MNPRSAGALLILAGLGMLWALWSDRSPFARWWEREPLTPAAAPPGAPAPGGATP
jgi:hypothetical protein